MSLTCPRCGLYSPEGAGRCDCGYDFVTGTVQASYLGEFAVPDHEPRFPVAAILWLIGGGFLGGGLLVGLVSVIGAVVDAIGSAFKGPRS